jgi:tetratricopeptide (TPR) repeat protein
MSSSSAEALALLRAGRSAEAEQLLRQALARGDADADALQMLGYLLASSGRANEGLPLLDRSIALDPRNPGFLANRAQVLMQLGLLDESVRDAQAAVGLEPRLAEAWLCLAQALDRLGRRDDSIAAAGRAATLAPRHLGAVSTLGRLLWQAGRGVEALQCFERAAELAPANASVHANLAMALQGSDRLEEALDAYLRAGSPEALANAGGLALELERLDEARALYARAASARPGYANASYGLGQVALRERRFAEGWEGYERRFETDPPQARPREIALPRLTAARLGSVRRVALWQEQGLGDHILFGTLLPELERRAIGVVVEVDARMLELYRRSLPAFEFVTAQDSHAAFASCDCHLPLGSLPALFRPDAASFAGQPQALLRADPARIGAMREALARVAGGMPLVAVSWRSPQSGARQRLGERKSLALGELAALEPLHGARLLDLQYGDLEDERREYEAREPGRLVRVPGLDTRADLEGVAAALVASGRLVTVSNATAHLAGALGVATELYMPRGWPPFSYWAAVGPDGRSAWYPSVRVIAHRG